MDQLTAYRILQLMPRSTRREIWEAYARLAKEYHPEEHPKEFNQIQEAYQLLTDRGENWSSDAVDDWFSDGEKTESEWESEEMCESDTRWKEEEEQEESEEKWTGRENRKNCRSRPAGQSGIRCMNWN